MSQAAPNPAAPVSSSSRTNLAPFTSSATEDAGGAHRQRDQQEAERHSRCPGRAVERCRKALDDSQGHRRHECSSKATHASKDTDRKYSADVVSADRGLDRLNDDQNSTGKRRGGN